MATSQSILRFHFFDDSGQLLVYVGGFGGLTVLVQCCLLLESNEVKSYIGIVN